MVKVNKKIVFIWIVAFIFAYISGGNLPYSLFYTFSITISFGLIYTMIVKKGLYAKFNYDREFYYVSDKADISIIIENVGRIPIPYVYVESKMLRQLIDTYQGDLIFLGADKCRLIKNEITFTKRGVYDLGNITLETSDFFSVFKSIKNLHNELNIKIYPKLYQLNDVRLTGRNSYENTINSKSAIEDFTLIKDIRKYNIGDNLKNVHWKLSAKYGELYVKNLDSISGKECSLFINMHIGNMHIDISGTIEEAMVDFSVSLANYMMNNMIKTRLFIHAKHQKNIEVDSKEDFYELMEYFLKYKSDGTSDFASFIKSNLRYIPRYNWLGIVSIAVDDNLRDVLINLKEMGYTVNVFYYENDLGGFKDKNDFKNIKFLKNLGINCINFREVIEKR